MPYIHVITLVIIISGAFILGKKETNKFKKEMVSLSKSIKTKDEEKMNQLVNVPDDFTPEKVELIKTTICKGATNDQLQLFVEVCKKTSLNPFMKQVYAVMRNSKGIQTMTIQVSIDGFRLIADRTGKYAPGRESTFKYNDKGFLSAATSYVKKQTQDGTWHEVAASASYDSYAQTYNGKPNNFWAKMPEVMLSKVAEALALRKAFPADLSGLYTKDEMGQADNNKGVDAATEAKYEEVQAEKINPITKEQIGELEDLLIEGDFTTDELSKMCAWLGVEDNHLEQLPQCKFKAAKDGIQKKINAKKEVL